MLHKRIQESLAFINRDLTSIIECVSKSLSIVRGEEVLKTNVETASYATLKKMAGVKDVWCYEIGNTGT